MKKTLLILTILAGGAAFTAPPVAAQTCTRGYMNCLNDTHDLRGALRVMADVECFSDYVRCMRRS